MFKLLEYFAGTALMKELPDKKNAALRLLQEKGVEFFDLHEEDGRACFRIFKKDLGIKELAECAETVSESGFFRDLAKSLRRPGLYIGALILAAGLILSDSIIWDVRFVRNGAENAERIKTAAERCGIESGAFIAGIDRRAAEARIMAECPDVSYVRINMEGTTAVIVTDERIVPPEKKDGDGADLCASEDGYVIRYETYAGRTVCEKGQTVKRGDVLISGTYETFHHGAANVRARGRVFALVKRSFVCETPVTAFEKTYTGREKTRRSLSLFSFRLGGGKAPANEGGAAFDENEEERAVTVFNAVTLPLKLKKTTYREYIVTNRRVGEEEAAEELEKLCARQYADITSDAEEIRSEKKKLYKENGRYKLYCEVWLVCNIAG